MHDTKSEITYKSTFTNIENSDIFAKFKNHNWSNTMKPITLNSTSSATNSLQAMQKSAQNTNTQQNVNHFEKDTFVQKDKKNVVKKVAIGTSIVLIAYSAFALIKYRKHYGGIFSKLAEPIKVLKARINPNGFKPSVSIEENDMTYLGEVSTHLRRLSNVHKKEKYIKHLFESTNFTEESKNKFIRWYGEYLR